jgi:hypothetical protein
MQQAVTIPIMAETPLAVGDWGRVLAPGYGGS